MKNLPSQLDLHPRSSSAGALPAPVAPPEEEAEFRLDLMRSLQLHWHLTLACLLVGLLAGALLLKFARHEYEAQCVIFLEPPSNKGISQSGLLRGPYEGGMAENIFQQQLANVVRPDVLLAAYKKIGPANYQFPRESEQQSLERLRQSIEVARVGSSYQFTITARAERPALSADLANAVANSYIDSVSRDQKLWDSRRLSLLAAERDRLQNELSADRAEQQKLGLLLASPLAGAPTDRADPRISLINEELMRARLAHDEAEARLTSLGASRGASGAALNAEADQMAAADPALVAQKSALMQRRAQLSGQMLGLTPAHPLYKQSAQEMAQIDGTLEKLEGELRGKAVERLQLKLQSDLEHTSAAESRLNAQLGQLATGASGQTFRLQRASDLAANITRLQNRLALVENQWRDLAIEDSAPADASLVAAAIVPTRHTKSNNSRNAALITLGGLLFGILLAVAAHKFDRRIYIADDVEQLIGVRPQVVLPNYHEFPAPVAEEQLLRLAAGIEYAWQQGSLNSCIFTGTGPGVGVTTVATRVREILATMGKGTVLVDASGGAAPLPSNSSQVAPAAPFERASRTTALRQQVSNELASEDENLVLTDAAPLALSAEAEYLARFVDSAVVVLYSGLTTKKQLRALAATLERLEVRHVEYVLNGVSMKKADPGFRKAVSAVESHIRAQQSQLVRQTERNSPQPGEERPRKLAEISAPAPVASPAPVQPLPESELPQLPSAPVEPEFVRQMQQSVPSAAPSGEQTLPRELPTQPSPSPAAVASAPPVEPFRDAVPVFVEPPLEDVSEAPVESVAEAQEYSGASRLSGMRNLVFSLGLKNLRQQRLNSALRPSPVEPEAEPDPQPEAIKRAEVLETQPAHQPVHPQPIAPPHAAPEQGARPMSNPEILPPRASHPPRSAEPFADSGSDSKAARSPVRSYTGYDDPQILPSKKGQY